MLQRRQRVLNANLGRVEQADEAQKGHPGLVSLVDVAPAVDGFRGQPQRAKSLGAQRLKSMLNGGRVPGQRVAHLHDRALASCRAAEQVGGQLPKSTSGAMRSGMRVRGVWISSSSRLLPRTTPCPR